MDFGKAFTYPTEDTNWLTKIGLGTLLQVAAFLLLPIPLLLGYQVAISRNVMNGEKQPLPDWNDMNRFFMDGLYLLIARFVYTLPFTLLLCVGVGVTFLPLLGGSNEDLTAVLGGVTAVAAILLSCLAILLSLVLLFITPAIDIQYIRTNNVRACFHFGEVLGISRAHAVDILLMGAVILGAYMVVGVVVSILYATICGFVVAIPLSYVAQMYLRAAYAHLVGQIGLKNAGGPTFDAVKMNL